MPINQNDNECQCGQMTQRVHCPHCGVYSVYARSHKKNTTKTRADGTEVDLQTYQCRRCGWVFDDDDWRLNCHAPRKLRAAHDAGRLMRQAVATDYDPSKPLPVAKMDLATDPGASAILAKMLEVARVNKAAREAKEAEEARKKAEKPKSLLEMIQDFEKEI